MLRMVLRFQLPCSESRTADIIGHKYSGMFRRTCVIFCVGGVCVITKLYLPLASTNCTKDQSLTGRAFASV